MASGINRVITMNDLFAYTGLRRTQLEKLIEQGRFPKPVKLSDRRKAWLESEVLAWQAEKIALRDNQGNSATKRREAGNER